MIVNPIPLYCTLGQCQAQPFKILSFFLFVKRGHKGAVSVLSTTYCRLCTMACVREVSPRFDHDFMQFTI